MKLLDILDAKGRMVYTVRDDNLLLEAVHKLVAYNVGAMAVVNPMGDLVGIISKRDVLRLTEAGVNFSASRVGEHMSRDVVVAEPTATIDELLATMSGRRIRHLPVVENGKLCGMISQGDLVKAMLDDARHEARQLVGFVTGQYPA